MSPATFGASTSRSSSALFRTSHLSRVRPAAWTMPSIWPCAVRIWRDQLGDLVRPSHIDAPIDDGGGELVQPGARVRLQGRSAGEPDRRPAHSSGDFFGKQQAETTGAAGDQIDAAIFPGNRGGGRGEFAPLADGTAPAFVSHDGIVRRALRLSSAARSWTGSANSTSWQREPGFPVARSAAGRPGRTAASAPSSDATTTWSRLLSLAL